MLAVTFFCSEARLVSCKTKLTSLPTSGVLSSLNFPEICFSASGSLADVAEMMSRFSLPRAFLKISLSLAEPEKEPQCVCVCGGGHQEGPRFAKRP